MKFGDDPSAVFLVFFRADHDTTKIPSLCFENKFEVKR